MGGKAQAPAEIWWGTRGGGIGRETDNKKKKRGEGPGAFKAGEAKAMGGTKSKKKKNSGRIGKKSVKDRGRAPVGRRHCQVTTLSVMGGGHWHGEEF